MPKIVTVGIGLLLLFFVTGLEHIGEKSSVPRPVFSEEVGIAELSPNGEAGGFAIPASGGSVGSCYADPHWGPGNACYSTGGRTFAEGASMTFGNFSSGYQGSITLVCGPGGVVHTLNGTCDPVPQNCHLGPGVAAWGSCSSYVDRDVPNGGQTRVDNLASGYDGSVYYSCSNTFLTQYGGSCTPKTPPPPPTGSCTSGGNFCAGGSTTEWKSGCTASPGAGWVDQGGGTYHRNTGVSCNVNVPVPPPPPPPPPPSPPNAGSCHVGPGTAYWDQGKTEDGNCHAYIDRDIANGGSTDLSNDHDGYSGSVTYMCNNGALKQTNPSCSSTSGGGGGGGGGACYDSGWAGWVCPGPALPANVSLYAQAIDDTSSTGNLLTIHKGDQARLKWLPSFAEGCHASGAWSGQKNHDTTYAYNPTYEIVMPSITSTYYIQCDGYGGSSPIRSATIVVLDNAYGEINATNCAIPPGGSTCNSTVSWKSDKLGSPSIKKDGVEFSTAPINTSASEPITFGTHTFSIYDGAIIQDEVTVKAQCGNLTGSFLQTWGSTWDGTKCTGISPEGPVLTLNATYSPVWTTQKGELTWNITGARDTCIASGDWSGNKNTNSFSNEYVMSPNPAVRKYFLECFYHGVSSGKKVAEIEFKTYTPPPVVAGITVCKSSVASFTDPSCKSNGETLTIDEGEEIKISWRGTNAILCNASGFTSTGLSVGTQTNISEPTPTNNPVTYGVTCRRSILPGSDSDTATVNVALSIPPKLSVNKNMVKVGDSVTLSWDTGTYDPGTASCSLTGPGGFNQSVTTRTGTQNVSILAQSKYTLTCGTYPPSSQTIRIIATGFES